MTKSKNITEKRLISNYAAVYAFAATENRLGKTKRLYLRKSPGY